MKKNRKFEFENFIVVFLITIAYAVMIIINSRFSGFIIIPVYLLCVFILKPEKLMQIFILFTFFNYPIVNAVGVWVVLVSFLVRPHKIVKLSLKSTMGFSAVFLISVMISLITAVDRGKAVNEIFTWIYVIGIILCCNLCREPQKILKAFYIAGITLAVVYLGQYLSLSYYSLIESWTFFRAPDYNYSATTIFCAIPIHRYLKRKINILNVWGEVLLLVGIIATTSRGVFALVIVYYLLLFIQNLKKLTVNNVALFIFIMIIFSFVIVRTELISRSLEQLSTIFNSNFYSNQVRIELYKGILTKMVPHNLLFGVGPNNFKTEYVKYFTISLNPDHAHNIYLQVLSEEGILGLLVVVLYLIIITLSIFQSMRSEASKQFINIVFMTLAVYAIYGMVEYVWGDSRSLSLFFAILTIYEMDIMKYKRKKSTLFVLKGGIE